MSKIVEEYQVLFGFAFGALIIGLILGGAIYLLGMKDRFASPAYANPGILGSEAIVDCLGVDKDGYAYLLAANGSIKRSNGAGITGTTTDIRGIGGGAVNDMNNQSPVTAVLPFDIGAYHVKADGTYTKKLYSSGGVNFGSTAVFPNGFATFFYNSAGRQLSYVSPTYPAQSMPAIDIKDLESSGLYFFQSHWDGSVYKWGTWSPKRGTFDFYYPDQSTDARRGPVLFFKQPSL